MAIFKRGKRYWYHFVFNGLHVQKSTKQGNPRVARQIEAACRTSLSKGEVGIVERKKAPKLKDFAQRFMDAIQVRCAAKPLTVQFYAKKLGMLLRFGPLADASLDSIDEALVESFVQYRSKQVSPASVNRELATLRRLLRLAQEWRIIDRVPRIRLLPGERIREFVLSHQQEQQYLEIAPQPLRDVALLILGTGLRPGEAAALEWRDVHLEPVNGAKFGYLHVRGEETGAGKSKFATRNLCLTARVKAMLETRPATTASAWVFPSRTGKPYVVTSLDHMHVGVRALLRLPKDFVVHSLRHTFGTRMGEARADAFEIKRLMGHSSVTVSQRYVHPSPEAIERAFERLEALNEATTARLLGGEKRQLPATVSATSINR
ncbi:MAG: site-specific integrase [Acidobacteria bacterium]|nr:site-specific integrase [Acidobacteriota bacterium]